MSIGRQHIPLSVRREIWSLPCVICGMAGDTEADHIIPVSRGGSSERGNLQPLCRQCNAKKRNRLSNGQLRKWFDSRRPYHICRHYYRDYRRTRSAFDCLPFRDWLVRWLGGLI